MGHRLMLKTVAAAARGADLFSLSIFSPALRAGLVSDGAQARAAEPVAGAHLAISRPADHKGVEVIAMETLPGGVQANTLARQIHDALMERILKGELPPGSRLKDNEVAALFGTSNTPVREAVRLLAQDGLVEMFPYRGCMVRQIDRDELAELFDVRAALEQLAVRLAAPRLTPGDLQQLQALVAEHDAGLGAEDRAPVAAASAAFHQFLQQAAGSRTLARILQDVNARIRIAQPVCLHYAGRGDRPYYGDILAALREGDGERAGALMAEHVARTKEQVLEALPAPKDD